ncbi:MAG: hypothetical protein GY953_49205 [bacterium]|nr:hypothetical protein [bacterium]
MGGSGKTTESVFEDIDGYVLLGFGNWLAESLDVSELSNEQVLLLFMVLDRGIKALLHNFPEVLLPLVTRAMAGFDPDAE